MLRLLLLISVFALPAAADCVTPENLAKGVTFKRQDGHVGYVQPAGHGMLQVDYVIDRNGWYDRRTTSFGIYETQFASWLSDAVLVGGKPPEYAWSFADTPPEPTPGKSWTVAIRQIETQVGYGTEMVEMVDKRGSDLSASFQYLAVTEAKLSGCTYRILPVEARFTGKTGTQTRRWIYFPDLGFGLETKRDGVQNGLIALTSG